MVNWSKTVPRWGGTTVEPPNTKKDEGYLVGDRPPAMWENWFRKGVYEAITENRSVIDSLDTSKAGLTWTQGQLNTLSTDKADKSWVTTELGKKANSTALTGHTGATNNPHSVTKSQVGLGRVDNTNDLEKPISTATQSALNLKANTTALNTHIGNEDNPHKVTKAQVGLSKVNNTTDAEKPISTATATALGLKADKTELTAGLELKADLTALTGHTGRTNNPHGVTKAQVGLDKVDNTSDANKPISLATATALGLKADLSFVNTELGKKANTTALNTHMNKTDNPHAVTKAQVGLSNVNNTSDLAKPISTATQTALNGKVDKNNDITAGVYTKVAVDKKGLVTGGYNLVADDIPSLTISKITGLQTALNGKTTEAYVNASIQTAIQSSWGGSY